MGNGPQVRQDLLPAARDFLLATARKGASTQQLRGPFHSPLQMTSITTSPINCFAPVAYWQNTSQNVDRPAVDWDLVVLKSALWQSQYKLLRHFSAPCEQP
jgi:hypothetical protein